MIRRLPLLLCLATLTNSQYQYKGKLKRFIISTQSPNLRNPGEFTTISHSYYTGLVRLFQGSKTTLEFSLTHRPANDTNFKNSQIITFNLPFNSTDKELIDKEITYSPTSKNKKFNISRDALKVYKIDHEVNLFNGKQIKENYTLNYVKAQIKLVKYREQGLDHSYPTLTKMEISYSDGSNRFQKLIKFDQTQIFLQNSSIGFFSFIFHIISCIISFSIPFLFGAFVLGLLFPPGGKAFFIIFLGQTAFMGYSTFSILALLKFSSRAPAITFPVLLTTFGVCCSRCILVGISNKMIELGRTRKEKIYAVIVRLAIVAWFIMVSFNFRLFFRSAIYYYFMVLVDLFFIHPSSSARNLVAFEVWKRVSLVVAIRQACIYSIYNYVYRQNNWEETPLFYEFVLPDLCVMLFMLIPFYLVFRLNKKKRGCFKRRMSKVPKLDVWGSWGFFYSQSAGWIGENQKLMKEAHKKSNFDSFHNIPSKRKMNKEKIVKQDCDTIDKIFNLTSKNPLNSKDFIATGSFNSRPGIRYVVNTRKAWDFILKTKNEAPKNSLFIENIWIKNQHRRKMVAYSGREDSTVKLVSILARKVLTNINFKESIKNKQFDKLKRGSVDLIIQPAFKHRPILVNKLKDQIVFYKAKYSTKGSLHGMNYNKKKFFSSDPFASERKLCPQMESVYFGDLMATKYLFYDIKDHERAYINHSKYQKIIVAQINPTSLRGRQVGSIDGITEGVFSSCRIDFFCFVDKDNLALIADQKICLVNWKTEQIKRTFELNGLYSPLLNAGIAKESIITTFWYNRISKRVQFSLGVITGGRKDIMPFLTDMSLISINYVLSGAFDHRVLYKKERIEGNSGQVGNTTGHGDVSRVSLNQVSDKRVLTGNENKKREMPYSNQNSSSKASFRNGDRVRLPRIDGLAQVNEETEKVDPNPNNILLI